MPEISGIIFDEEGGEIHDASNKANPSRPSLTKLELKPNQNLTKLRIISLRMIAPEAADVLHRPSHGRTGTWQLFVQLEAGDLLKHRDQVWDPAQRDVQEPDLITSKELLSLRVSLHPASGSQWLVECCCFLLFPPTFRNRSQTECMTCVFSRWFRFSEYNMLEGIKWACRARAHLVLDLVIWANPGPVWNYFQAGPTQTENRYPALHRIVAQKLLALVGEVFKYGLVGDSFQHQHPNSPQGKWLDHVLNSFTFLDISCVQSWADVIRSCGENPRLSALVMAFILVMSLSNIVAVIVCPASFSQFKKRDWWIMDGQLERCFTLRGSRFQRKLKAKAFSHVYIVILWTIHAFKLWGADHKTIQTLWNGSRQLGKESASLIPQKMKKIQFRL